MSCSVKCELVCNNSHRTVQDRTDSENVKLCATFSDFFQDKICKLKSSIASIITIVPSPADAPHTGPPCDFLAPVTRQEILTILSSIPAKSCALDFIPTSLLKSCGSVFSDLIANMANLCFTQGSFPTRYKFAIVTPLLKKTWPRH